MVEDLIELNEGRRHSLYQDTTGNWTIGIGHNLSAKPLSDAAVNFIFQEDLKDAQNDLHNYFPWVSELDEVRYAALLDMCFNMGIGNKLKGLRSFTTTMPLIQQREFKQAADNIRNSRSYGKKLPVRANRNAKMIETGEWPVEL